MSIQDVPRIRFFVHSVVLHTCTHALMVVYHGKLCSGGAYILNKSTMIEYVVLLVQLPCRAPYTQLDIVHKCVGLTNTFNMF